MEDLLINVKNMSKRFVRSEKASQKAVRSLVFQSLFFRTKASEQDFGADAFWANRNINITLKRGETLGVIGRNGAGKSTLLNILAGMYSYDEGSVEVSGRVVSMINLSTGMNGNLTGRQNILQKGLLNGLTESEIKKKTDSIIDFAELHHCIDAPYKTYSAGMKMRLAFSINIHSEADVMIVDEVLSVGDFEFRQKCHAWLQSIQDQVAFILVTHNMSDLNRFCDKAMLLENGNVVYDGDVGGCIAKYNKSHISKSDKTTQSFTSNHIWGGARSFDDGDQSHVSLKSDDILNLFTGEKIEFEIEAFLAKRMKHPTMGINIINAAGQILVNMNSERMLENAFFENLYASPYRFNVNFSKPRLLPGRYYVVIVFADGLEIIYRNKIIDLTVSERGDKAIPYYGLVDGDWTIKTGNKKHSISND